MSLTPVKTKDGYFKTGIWVRDNIQGIGTLSFVDENRWNFAAHLDTGSRNMDTGGLVRHVSRAALYPSSVYLPSVNKGKNGNPGEIRVEQ